MSVQIDAPKANGGECNGCRYQADKGQRKHIHDAEYLCENCHRPLCREHINHEERGDWWLCMRCWVIYERKRQQRRVTV